MNFKRPHYPEPKARHTDPETSLEAAASVAELANKQHYVLDSIIKIGPCTLEELVAGYRWFLTYPQSDSGIRTRCSELVKLGLVVDSGERRLTASGRKAVVWKVKP